MQGDDTDHEKVSKTKGSQEQPDFIEGDGTFEIPLYVSYARHRRQATGQAVDRRGESQQEIPQSPPESYQ